MAKLPKTETLFDLYPAGTPAEVAALVGGPIGDLITKHDWETCCVRMSYALNYAGEPVEGFAKIANPAVGGTVRAYQGADKKWYIASVFDMKAYLKARYGPQKPIAGRDAAARKAAVAGKGGIIVFGFRHVDVWDGGQVKRIELFDHSSIPGHGLLLWPGS